MRALLGVLVGLVVFYLGALFFWSLIGFDFGLIGMAAYLFFAGWLGVQSYRKVLDG